MTSMPSIARRILVWSMVVVAAVILAAVVGAVVRARVEAPPAADGTVRDQAPVGR